LADRYVLIDGHSLAYRAFYALPADLATSSGQVTNAVYGFVSMLIKVLEDFKPDAVIVAFDRGRPDFRIERFEEYKAHRKPMPDSLREQMDLIRAVLEAMGIACLEKEGYEADDVLATLVTLLPGEAEVFIVTGDRDALQLVGEKVKVVANRRGITDILVYDESKVEEKLGIRPRQVVDYLALKGDVSDNIPGVPGFGEKTAASLIAEYGSLDEIYAHLHEMKNAKWRRLLEEHRESAYLSRDLASLRRDVPLSLPELKDMQLRPWDEEAVHSLFSSLEFRKLYERLQSLREDLFRGEEVAGAAAPAYARERADEEAEESGWRDLLQEAERRGEIYLFPRIAGEGFTRGEMRAVAVAAGSRVCHMPLSSRGDVEELRVFLENLTSLRGLRLACYRGKDFMVQCAKACRIMPACDFDVQVASYLVNPSGSTHDLDAIARRFLGVSPAGEREAQLDLLEEEPEEKGEDLSYAMVLERLVHALKAEMNLRDLRSLFEGVEMPLQEVLAKMEICGVRLDGEVLASMEKELKEELDELEKRAHEMAGEPFNLNSPQQLSRVLFETLELTPVRRTKTGYATDVSVLQALRDKHPIAEVLLRYRELSKLLNTYVAALPRMVDPDTGRLHACFNQTVTATGRLSSSNPNLQNIPVRTPLGKNIRRAFLPTSPQGSILAADYSQIELRILAHLSGDEGLRRAFSEGLDIHASTASEVFGIPFNEVNEEQRRRAKVINFGIIYGMSPYGLAEQLAIDEVEAERYIEAYFRKYPEVRGYLDRTVSEASRQGYVTTLLGRRREIPELLEGNVRLRKLGERLAFNTPIQGSAADVIKLAMLRIHKRLHEEGMLSRMILQVHDELVFDVEPGEAEAMTCLVREEMENAVSLQVPLVVEIGLGPSWYEAK